MSDRDKTGVPELGAGPGGSTNKLELKTIRVDGDTQTRDVLNPEVISDYADRMRAGDTFPPVVVFYDGADRWLSDGFHRVEAAKLAGLKTIAADVRQGGKREAILHGIGANAHHGLRRSNADKRRAALALLNDPEWSQWSDREIARQCGVSNTFVSSLRSVTVNVDSEKRYRTKHGTEAVMSTAGMGADKTGQLTRALGAMRVSVDYMQRANRGAIRSRAPSLQEAEAETSLADLATEHFKRGMADFESAGLANHPVDLESLIELYKEVRRVGLEFSVEASTSVVVSERSLGQLIKWFKATRVKPPTTVAEAALYSLCAERRLGELIRDGQACDGINDTEKARYLELAALSEEEFLSHTESL